MTVWLEIIAFRPLSLAPPTTPCLVRCAFIQLCIQPHPRLIPPLRSYYYFSSARDLAPTTSFLAKPVDGRQRETKQGEPETRSSRLDIPPPPPPPLPLVAKSGLTRLFLRKIRPQGEGETWSLTSLCVGPSGSHGERKAENLHRSDPRVYVFSLLRIGREMIVLCSRFKVLVKTIENLWMSPWPSDPHIFSKSRLSLAWSFGIARRTQSVRERKVQG